MVKRRVLLVGASGQVGNMLRRYWTSAPSTDLEFIYQTRGPVTDPRCEFSWSPLKDDSGLQRFADTFGSLDTVIIMAGIKPGVGKNLSLNATIAENVLMQCQSANVGRVLIASSSSVYGNYKNTPFHEDDDCNPVNAYGKAKLVMEKNCLNLNAIHRGSDDTQVCCLRIGNVAGADSLRLEVLVNETDKIPVLEIFKNEKSAERSYIGPASLARAITAIINAPDPLPEILNMGSDKSTAMVELLEAAGVAYNKKFKSNLNDQCITLNCQRLVNFIEFSRQETTAKGMIEQVRALVKDA